ncbi:MAG TPA: hypothetical protein VJK54_05890 [Chthoniobacterales bacterium]|nr:hypothetical protein [Chthoniobacterales bacterium]
MPDVSPAEAAAANLTTPSTLEGYVPGSKPSTSSSQAEQKPSRFGRKKVEKPRVNYVVEPLHQHEVLRSGDPERTVKLDEKTTKLAIDRLVKARLYSSLLGPEDEIDSNLPRTKRSNTDRLVLDSELGGRLEKRQLSGQDLFLANRVVLNELILTQLAIARVVRRNPSFFNDLKDHPLIGRLVGIGDTEIENLGIPPTNLDRFIEVYGVGNWRSAREAENQLRDLNGLYMRIEASFYRNGIRDPNVDQLRDRIPFFGRRYHDPIFDERNGLIYLPRIVGAAIPPPADRPGQIANITRETGQIPHDEFVRQVRNAIEARVVRGEIAAGTTFEHILLGATPTEAYRILYDANQAAAAQESTQAWKRILNGESYSVTNTDIEAQRDRLKKPPTDEDVKKLDDELFVLDGERIALENTESDRATDETATQEKYTSLSGRLTTETANLPPFEAKYREEEAAYRRNEPRLRSETNRDSRRYNDLVSRQTAIRKSASRMRNPALRQQAETRAEAMKNEIEKALEASNQSSNSLKAARDRVARARGLRDAQRALITALTADVATARADLTTATTNHRTATEHKRLKQREIDLKTAEKTETERKKTAKEHIGETDEIDAMDRRIDIATNRARIIEAQFDQRESNPNTSANLTNSEVNRDGQVMGTERMRELIIQTVNKAKWDPELARKMLSDETIARGILEYLQIDLATAITIPLAPGALGPPAPATTFNNLFEEIQTRRDALEFLPINQTLRRADLQREIREREITATQAVLRYISREHKSKISSVINHLIDEGLRSAEKGRPFLNFVR